VIALSFALPLGLGGGIFLAEFASPRLRTFFSLVCDLLAGIPSIIVGLFGLSLTLFIHARWPAFAPCLLLSGLALGLLVLPYLVRSTQTALEDLPASLRLTTAALGGDKTAGLFHVLLPRALPGILSGVILATGRAAEDTAVIMLTGAVAMAGMPHSLFDGFEALPFFIYYTASQYAGPGDLERAFAAALILLSLCLLLFGWAGLVRRQLMLRLLYR